MSFVFKSKTHQFGYLHLTSGWHIDVDIIWMMISFACRLLENTETFLNSFYPVRYNSYGAKIYKFNFCYGLTSSCYRWWDNVYRVKLRIPYMLYRINRYES